MQLLQPLHLGQLPPLLLHQPQDSVLAPLTLVRNYIVVLCVVITSVHMRLIFLQFISTFCSLLFAACFHWMKDLGGWELETPLLVGLVLGDLV